MLARQRHGDDDGEEEEEEEEAWHEFEEDMAAVIWITEAYNVHSVI